MTWFRSSAEGKIPFVASTNAQQVELPVYADEDIVIKTKIMVPSTFVGETTIIDNEWNANCFALYISQNQLCVRDNTTRITFLDNKPWKWMNVEYNTNDGSVIVDGVTYGGQGGSYNHKKICLFGVENAHYSCCAIASMQIYKDGNLYMNLEPRQNALGEGYLYDTIGEQGYYSNTDTPLEYYYTINDKDRYKNFAIPIFENGEFKNDDIFTVAYPSNTAAGPITLVDSELVFPVYPSNAGAIRVTNNNGNSFLLIAEFEGYTESYIQFGRCASDADPYNCIAAGWNRIVYTWINGVNGGYYPSAVGIKSQSEGAFLAGTGFKIKSIYGFVGDNYVIPSNNYY